MKRKIEYLIKQKNVRIIIASWHGAQATIYDLQNKKLYVPVQYYSEEYLAKVLLQL